MTNDLGYNLTVLANHVYITIALWVSVTILNALFLDGWLSFFQINVLAVVWFFFWLMYYADDGKNNG